MVKRRGLARLLQVRGLGGLVLGVARRGTLINRGNWQKGTGKPRGLETEAIRKRDTLVSKDNQGSQGTGVLGNKGYRTQGAETKWKALSNLFFIGTFWEETSAKKQRYGEIYSSSEMD